MDLLLSRAVILAGGRGTRLAPYTTVLPKPLMPVGDMPVLEILIRQLERQGIDRITLCVGYLSSLIETYFGDGAKLGVSIDYSHESCPLGTAGPIANIRDISSTFLVMNGDVLSDIDIKAMYDHHVANNAMVTVGTFSKTVRIDLGVVTSSEDGLLVRYDEKPELNYQVSMGVYLMEPDVIECLTPDERIDLPDLLIRLREQGCRVSCFGETECWLDIGRHEDLERATKLYEENPERFWT